MRNWALLPIIALVLATSGCKKGGGDDPDGGAVDSGLGLLPPAAPALPEAAAAPEFGTCPTGWRPVDGICEPWPSSGRASCGAGEMHLPGEPGCQPVGAPCPAGDFPEGLPAAGVVHVLAGATGGDGSAASPHGSLAAALSGAAPGTVIALGKGSYGEIAVVPEGITLWGACPAATLLSSDVYDGYVGILQVGAADVVIRDLGFGPGRRPAISIGRGGVARVQGVVIEGAMSRGIVVTDGASLDAEDLLISGGVSRETDGNAGVGMIVEAGTVAGSLPSSATVRRAVFRGNQAGGIGVWDPGTTLVLEDSAIIESLPVSSNGMGGAGLTVAYEGSAELRRVAVEDGQFAGMAALLQGKLTVEDSVLRDTIPNASGVAAGQYGRALDAEAGSQVVLRRVLIDRAYERGIFASGTGTLVTLEDSVVRNVRSEVSSGSAGHGIAAQGGGELRLSRTLVSGNRGQGISSIGTGSRVVLTDVMVLDTESNESDGQVGYGVSAQLAGAIEFTRLTIERARDIGLSADGAGVSLSGTDLIIRDTRSREDNLEGGRGIEVNRGASLRASRLLLERNRGTAIFSYLDGAYLELEDLTVRDTLPQESTGLRGRGLSLQDGSSGSIVRAVVEGSRTTGIFVTGASGGGSYRLEDLVVRDTAIDGETGQGGMGLSVQSTAFVELHRGVFERNASAGIVVTDRAFLTATDVQIRGSLADANLEFGRGIEVTVGSTASFTGLLVEDNRDLGVTVASGGTSVALNRFLIRGTASRATDGRYGRGLTVEGGASVTARHGRFENNREISVAALLSSSIVLEDVEIVSSLPRECATATCSDAPAGTGLGSYSNSTVTATNFLIAGASLCGVQLARGGQIDLDDGEVRDSVIGACVQVEGYDLNRLQAGVRYLDNEVNLDSTDLPVPDPSGTVGGG